MLRALFWHIFGNLLGVHFLWAQLGAFLEAQLGPTSEPHLGSSLGVHFSGFWGLLRTPLGGLLGQGLIWGTFWGPILEVV